MAGPPCKVIINNMHGAVSQSLETVLNMPETITVIGEEKRLKLIQRLADIDNQSYSGHFDETIDRPDSLSNVVMALYDAGVFTDDIFYILRHPDNPAVP